MQASAAERQCVIVTGANKGIGFEIVRGLCAHYKGTADVLLTSRNVALGQAAVAELTRQGLRPLYHQLDITDADSCAALRDHVRSAYTGGIAALVNNAGFAFKGAATEPFDMQARETVRINFFGTLQVCQLLLPLMNRDRGRVVNVASMAGSVRILSPPLREEVMRPDLTEGDLVAFMRRFVDDVGAGAHRERGWPNTAYGMSKVGVAAMTRVHARDIGTILASGGGGGGGGGGRSGVVVNCCCPGWCKSDMAGWESPTKTAAQGADTPILLATLPDGTDCHGQFVADRKVRGW